MKWLKEIYGELTGIMLVGAVLLVLNWKKVMIWLDLQPSWFLPVVAAVVIIPAVIATVKDRKRTQTLEWTAFAMLCWLIGGAVIWGVWAYQNNIGGIFWKIEDMREANKKEWSSTPCVNPVVDKDDVGMGGPTWPLSKKYVNLQYLGQVFTAADCGTDRLKEVTGNDAFYSWGVRLYFAQEPSWNLTTLMQDLGFKKNSETSEWSEGVFFETWELQVESIPVSRLLQLKPYADEIEYADCTNCG